MNKVQSESQAALQMCQILQSQGYFEQNFKPSKNKLREQLDHNETAQSQSICQSITSNHKEEQDEEEKTFLRDYSAKTMSSGSKSSRNQQNTFNQSLYSQSQKSHSQILQKEQILPRVYKINQQNGDKIEADQFFCQKYKKNMKKLEEGQNKGQHHMPIMHYNSSQLKLFILTILNPILKANNEYNELYDTPDLIKFDDLNVNMISESSIKDLLFQECFYQKQENRRVNQTFIQFKNYRQRIFNIQHKNNEVKNYQEYPFLVQMIDPSLERYKFPQFMTQHIKNYHKCERGKPSYSSPKVKEDFNRKTFLTMLMIALSDKEPTTDEFEKVKNEMGRLSLVGDSIINLCQVMTLIFSGKKSFSEKDLDAVKNQTVKNERLNQKAKSVGLNYLIIKAKYYKKTPLNPQVEAQQSPRDLGEVMKSLAGLFSIYLGFGATYLLLSDFGIVEPPTADLIIKIGKISVAQKVVILKTISQNRRDFLVYKHDHKMHLFKILCNQQYPGNNRENPTGSEFVEVLNKFVMSRGLFMKQDLPNIFSRLENTDFNDDDSVNQPRDYSIALSNKTSSSNSLQSGEWSSSSQKDSDSDYESENKIHTRTHIISSQKNKFFKNYENLDLQNEEEKSQLSLDENCQDYQPQDEILTEDRGYTIESIFRENFQKYSNHSRSAGDDEERKTGGEAIDEGIVYEIEEPNQRQFDDFERLYKETMQEGYQFKNQEILMQSIVHKSVSNRLLSSGYAFDDYSQLDKDVVMQYNLQIPQCLGDSILNFTISKLFYCETADNQKQWHGDFFVPTKLHELKTWFSSSNWLSFALYENYYCTLTEEIPRDAQFKETKFEKQAQLAINQLQNKKIQVEEAIQIAPRVPLIFEQNDKFEEQINEFNGVCFRQCLAADKNKFQKISDNPSEELKVTSKSLSLKLFKDNDVQEQDQNEVDFTEINENFMQNFSDVIQALIGGIFMDSGDLDKTQMILLKLINCPSVSSFPILQHDRTAVLAVFNSKPYCKGIKLYHTLEEIDGSVYIMGWMGKLQFRNNKYSKEKKKKLSLFYQEMGLYFRDAYKEFETSFVLKRKENDKREPTNDQWLEFNQQHRKIWRVKVFSVDQKRFSAIKVAANYLCKFVSSAEENFKTRDNQNISDMRVQIILYLNLGLQTIDANPKSPLLVLESERVQSSRIREILQCSDIKFIDGLSFNMKNVENFVDKLNDRQVHRFYEHLIKFGQ